MRAIITIQPENEENPITYAEEIPVTFKYERCNAIGDVNGDGGWNVLDIVSLANCVLYDNCANLGTSGYPDGSACAADMNGDGDWNVLDIVAVANCVLNDNCQDL